MKNSLLPRWHGWREVALNSRLFWAAFLVKPSPADPCRLPIVLERTGSTMLNIRLVLPKVVAMGAVCRRFGSAGTMRQSSTLYSTPTLEFPALKTLVLRPGPGIPRLPLAAPQLRTLDLEAFEPANLRTLFSPSLENIRLYKVNGDYVETLANILARCPRVWRLVLQTDWRRRSGNIYTDADFEVFTRRQPLAPALRTLELGTDFRLGDYIAGKPLDLTPHLLSGFGPLHVFELFDKQEVELRNEDGRIRRLEDESYALLVDDVWERLSIYHNPHETVREIRIGDQWAQYASVFKRFPPQREDGVTFVLRACWHCDEAGPCVARSMRIPGLAKLGLLVKTAALVARNSLEGRGVHSDLGGRNRVSAKCAKCASFATVFERNNSDFACKKFSNRTSSNSCNSVQF
ncbi:hypothetical protein B0H14DRAFT_3868924 [Mycena olivaceomarginata]|nr:hypothetical protein B0H14DRAFT_3868924 [Mycena olivaceomarginata]